MVLCGANNVQRAQFINAARRRLEAANQDIAPKVEHVGGLKIGGAAESLAHDRVSIITFFVIATGVEVLWIALLFWLAIRSVF
jgi:hypothetical protein